MRIVRFVLCLNLVFLAIHLPRGIATAQTNQAILSSTNSLAKKPSMASELIGMPVENAQRERIGEIKDIAVDVAAGRLNYVVFSTGGFIGLGEKLIALPASALKMDATEHSLILNADKESLKRARGMDRANWPTVADRSWSISSHTNSIAKKTSPEKSDAGIAGSKIEEAAGAEFALAPGPVLKGSEVLGMDVVNEQNKRLGEIRDIGIDLETGRIVYAALASGGFLGLGERLVAVSPKDLVRSGSDEKSFILNAKMESLPVLPALNPK